MVRLQRSVCFALAFVCASSTSVGVALASSVPALAPTLAGATPLPAPSPPSPPSPPGAVLPLSAASLPSVKLLLAAIAEGAGRAPAASTLVATISDGTTLETQTTYCRGDDVRTVDVRGPLHREHGIARGKAWSRNDNGQVVFHPAFDAKDEAFVYPGGPQRVERATSIANAFVLIASAPDGEVTSRTVDRSTGRVVRTETQLGGDDTIVSYDDFRTTSGVTQPWHWTERDGHPEDDRDARVTRFDVAAVDSNDVAVPATRALIEFPQGVSRVALPVTFHDGVFIVRVEIGGRGYDFALQSGATSIAIDLGTARALDLTLYGHRSVVGGGRYVEREAIVPEMHVGALTMRDVVVTTIPQGVFERTNVYHVVGYLGYDFFAATKLIVKYVEGTVTALDPAMPMQVPIATPGFSMPLRLAGETPVLDVTIDGMPGKAFAVDTGCACGFLVSQAFTRQHPNVLGDRIYPRTRKQTFLDVGGEFDVTPLELRRVSFGKVNFDHYPAYGIDGDLALRDGDGTVGEGFLVNFDLYFDYPNAQMWFFFNDAMRKALGR